MPKVVIHPGYGGFAIPHIFPFAPGETEYDIKRDDPRLVELVETHPEGFTADPNGWKGQIVLRICTIPDGVKWRIAEYDGAEWVEEVHRTWGPDPVTPEEKQERALSEILAKLSDEERAVIEKALHPEWK